MAQADDGVDLYADLGAGDADVENLEYKDKYETLVQEHADLQKALKAEQEKTTRLEKENAVLERNLCCIYDTAKLELERKNQIIKDTREQLMEARRSSG